MLQNRIDPWGRIIKTAARGAWMGNRGLLHDENQQIVRPFRLKAWITCVLEFKGRKRQVMTPNRYTELFFLDEATSFSSGHRPCAECRRTDFNRWKTLWLEGNPGYRFNTRTPIREIDAILHEERTGRDGTYTQTIGRLPNGCFVVYEKITCLVADGSVYPWTPAGYGQGIVVAGTEKVEVITPRSIVRAFRAGYVPQMGRGSTIENPKP
jgi:hypothetical protein